MPTYRVEWMTVVDASDDSEATDESRMLVANEHFEPFAIEVLEEEEHDESDS